MAELESCGGPEELVSQLEVDASVLSSAAALLGVEPFDASTISPNGTADPIKVPLLTLQFKQPVAGWPPLLDWKTVAADVLTNGFASKREPIDVIPNDTQLSIVKGFTRASVCLFIADAIRKIEDIPAQEKEPLQRL
jgi:hypothetical protein